jgi:hypothetical protein
MDRDHEERDGRICQVRADAERLIGKLKSITDGEVGEFLKLDVLAETLDRRVGQVGRYERSVYFEAFQVLISEKFDLKDMEPCWRAA